MIMFIIIRKNLRTWFDKAKEQFTNMSCFDYRKVGLKSTKFDEETIPAVIIFLSASLMHPHWHLVF